MTEQCEECGARIPGGRDGCQQLWDAMRYDGRVAHAAAFDAYCMQHPARYCASAKSYAAHLTRFCCGIERDRDPRVYRAIQKWLDGQRALDKPPVLGDRGAVTISDVSAAETDVLRAEAVERWIDAVWQAYATQHETARRWIQQALASG